MASNVASPSPATATVRLLHSMATQEQEPYTNLIEEEEEEEEEEERQEPDEIQLKPRGKAQVRHCSCEVQVLRSKGAILVLLWNALVFGYQFILLHLLLSSNLIKTSRPWLTMFFVFLVNFVLSKLLYPLAGWLADVHYGRHKVMQYSMRLMWVGCLLLLLEQIGVNLVPDEYRVAVEAPIFLVVFFLDMLSLAGFHTNIIPFGIDQMPEASTEQLKAFIRWYYWTRNLGVSVNLFVNVFLCLATNDALPVYNSTYYSAISIVISGLFLSLALCSDFIFSGVLNKEHKKYNPMKDLRGVLTYAAKHKQPVKRSAFTFNPNFNPKRIDYAMEYFGGPFTYEQVENVKTFLSMLKVLAAFGCFVFLQAAVRIGTHYFVEHLDKTSILFDGSCLPPQFSYWVFNPPFIVLSIPIFEFLIYPLLSRRGLFPRTLRRIGAAICFTLVALFVFLVIDVVGHTNNEKAVCMFLYESDSSLPKVKLSGWVVMVPIVLATIAEMMGNIGVFEFICAQSPYSIRGFMIGFFYFLQGIFSLAAFTFIFPIGLPFLNDRNKDCGLYFYVIMLVTGLVALVAYVIVTRRYKRRERQMIGNEQQMIEAYYEHVVAMNAKDNCIHIRLEPSIDVVDLDD